MKKISSINIVIDRDNTLKELIKYEIQRWENDFSKISISKRAQTSGKLEEVSVQERYQGVSPADDNMEAKIE
jgi:hypothetical protein